MKAIVFLIMGWWWDFRRAERQSKGRGSLSLPVLAVPPLLVPCWLLILRSFSWSSFGACLTPQWAQWDHYQQKTRKPEKGKYFPDILVISICLPRSQRSARVKAREGQGCTARTGDVRPSRRRELLNYLSHLPKPLLDGEACSIPGSWMLGCRLGFVTRCQMAQAQLCSSFHHWYYWWSTSQESIAWNLQCK